MKLSKAAWNNVIIFSVMGMILLINLNSQDTSNTAQDNASASEIALLTEQQHILTLAVNQEFLIERIGKSWRATPEKLSEQAIEQMVLAWQQNSGVPLATAPVVIAENATKVTIELAGEQAPLVYSLYLTEQVLLVYHHNQDIWLQLPKVIDQQLLPANIFFE